MFEELCVGFDFSPSLVKEQEQQATSSILCRSEEPTLSVAEARTMLTLKAGAVQKVVGCLQPSFHGRSISVTTFPCVYQAFYPTPQVLDQLLQSALSPIWGPRPQENSQDMWQMLRHSRINLTLAYLQDLLPGSVLKHQATPLLIQVDLFQATELETEAPAPAPALLPGAEAEKGPHLELDGTPVLFLPSLLALEPAAAPSGAPDPERVPSAAPAQVPGPELDSTGPRGLLGFPPQAPVTAADSAPVPEASHPCRVTGKKQPDGKPSLMAFSPRDVAEQLTAIDAEVFKNVEPSECLGSTWGKRNRPGHENVAPTVWATVVQFNRVVKCVMTSCLGDPNVTARGRAKVLERWIEVARECRALRNISSLHAVLSALQSVPIHRLKKTWGKVSRKSCRKFKKLCDEDNSLSWELLIKSSLDEQEDGVCLVHGQVGEVFVGWEAPVMAGSGGVWTDPGGDAELAGGAGAAFHFGPRCQHLDSSRLLRAWGGRAYVSSLNQLSVSLGSQAPTAPSVFTTSPRGGHPACPRDGHCQAFPQARWTNGLPSLESEWLEHDRCLCMCDSPLALPRSLLVCPCQEHSPGS
ncbi:ral guanine nucleotide dissociation stimulator-like isoform X4 [Equus caballus]